MQIFRIRLLLPDPSSRTGWPWFVQ